MKSRPGKERRTGTAEAEAEDLEAAEILRREEAEGWGKFCLPEGCGVTTGMHHP